MREAGARMNPPSSSESFESRVARLSQNLALLRDPQERLAWLMHRPPVPQVLLAVEQRRDDHLVPGCASRFWLACSIGEGRCHFACDSDSAILRSLGALLCETYDGFSPEEVAAREPEFLYRLGILDPLTENRRRTARRLRERMRDFANASST